MLLHQTGSPTLRFGDRHCGRRNVDTGFAKVINISQMDRHVEPQTLSPPSSMSSLRQPLKFCIYGLYMPMGTLSHATWLKTTLTLKWSYGDQLNLPNGVELSGTGPPNAAD